MNKKKQNKLSLRWWEWRLRRNEKEANKAEEEGMMWSRRGRVEAAIPLLRKRRKLRGRASRIRQIILTMNEKG